MLQKGLKSVLISARKEGLETQVLERLGERFSARCVEMGHDLVEQQNESRLAVRLRCRGSRKDEANQQRLLLTG